MQNHDKFGDPLLEYAVQCIEHHVARLVSSVPSHDLDDLMQESLLTFLRERHRYDEKVGSPKTFVVMLVDMSVNRFLAARQRMLCRSEISLDQIRPSDEPVYNASRFGEISELDRIYLATDLEMLLETRLTLRQRMICRMLIKELGIKAIARKLSVSRQTVYREFKEIGKQLQHIL